MKFEPREIPDARSATAKATRYALKKDIASVLLGKIPNMPGHCVIDETKSEKIHAGYHTGSFIELTNDKTD